MTSQVVPFEHGTDLSPGRPHPVRDPGPGAEALSRVLIVDPGQRAGWASAHMGVNRIERVNHGVLPLKEMALKLAADQGIWGTFRTSPSWDVLGYETWRLRPNKAKALIGDDMQPSQLIGQVRLIGWLSGTSIIGYGPELKFVPETKPKWLEARKAESTEEHDKDALDLLWHHYFVNWLDPTQEPA